MWPQNKVLKWILIIGIVIFVCWLARLRFHGSAGEGGIEGGVSHGQH